VSIILMEAKGQHLEATTAYLVDLGVPVESIGHDRVRGVGRGAVALHDLRRASQPVPPVEARGNHSGAESSCETPRWPGKLCVAYTGAVYPCIFSRRMELGHVAREPLATILDRVRDRRATGIEVDAARDQLACFDCRLTALALGTVPA
jgi:radical SAM protein with 4Fe4S-binding SPASM domain